MFTIFVRGSVTLIFSKEFDRNRILLNLEYFEFVRLNFH